MIPYLDYFLGIVILISVIILSRLSFPERISFSSPSKEKLVSIIVPTRNESGNIGECLDSLSKLNYSNYEIIVVDGASSDDTKKIADEYSNVNVIEEPEKPNDWVGKSWACHTGQREANGEILLFTDGDTIHHPDSLSTMVNQLDKSDGFVTLVTTQRLKSFWEKLLVVAFFVGIVTLGGFKQTKEYGYANGQYMMFNRSLYDDLGDEGAFSKVKSQVVDDFALANYMTNQGINIKVVSKLHLVEARMYQNLSKIIHGYTKILASRSEILTWKEFMRANIVQAWGILSFVFIPIGFGRYIHIEVTYAGIIGYMLFAITIMIVEKYTTGKITYVGLIYPIYLIVYQHIVMRSLVYTNIKDEIEWKGRRYSITIEDDY